MKIKKKTSLSILILLFLIITVALPIIKMLLEVRWNEFDTLISSQSFKEALTNSLIITTISTILSIIVAYILAYTINRTKIKHKKILIILITIPMLIPSISHGLGLINLFGASGIFTKNLEFNIIGPLGIVLGSMIYSFPVAFLMINDGFNYIDNTLYDVAKVLGLTKMQTFKKVTLCYLKKPLLSATFAVFTMIFTDYGVPLSVGGNFITLPVFLYKEVIGLLDFSKGTMIGLFLLIPAIISFLFDTFTKDYNVDDANNKKYQISNTKSKEIILKLFTYLTIIFILTIIGSFIYYAFINNPVLDKTLSFKHFETLLNDNAQSYLLNSLIISILVALFGTICAYTTAYVTARIKGKMGRLVHIFAICSLAIPGIILGLSYIITFKNTFIYQTYIILILVNIIHFFASPYLLAYNALNKVNPNYEIVAKTCNIKTFYIIKDVIIPCTKKTIREMFSYFFVNSMITISAVTFLFSTSTMPVSLLINNYEGNNMLGEAAIVSLIILIINLVLKIIFYLIDRKEIKNERTHLQRI